MAQLATFREALQTARHPVALAGAGLSAASGIPTFRGAGGLWRQHDALSLATPEAFDADPSMVWQFYHYRRQICLAAQPNTAHDNLAFLSTSKGAGQIFPKARNGFHFITQNVDGLSIRAANVMADQNPRLPLEMHGSLFRTLCLSCGSEMPNFDSPIVPALGGTEDISKGYTSIPKESLPHCSKENCSGLLRPAVVWFGESIPLIESIIDTVEACDLLLILGTSSTVYPAAGFHEQVRRNGGKVAVFNIDEGGKTPADWFFSGKVEETLPYALGFSPV